MKGALCSLLFFAQVARAGLAEYSSLVVADGTRSGSLATDSIRITYLGVNGYQLEAGEHALLIDPYFTRFNLARAAFNQPVAPDLQRVTAGLNHVRPRVDAVLVTHAHFDHLMDVPEVMRRTGAQLIADATAANLVQASNIPRRKCSVVQAGASRRIGPWKISVLAAQHDRVIGSTPPYPGTVGSPARRPTKPADWRLGNPLAFLIEANGRRIYIESGGLPDDPPPRIGKVDLAILGVALPDSRRRFPLALRSLQPRYVLSSHQDDFFRPFARGFTFGKLTNFPALKRNHEKEHLPGRLILLDYFRPWTIR